MKKLLFIFAAINAFAFSAGAQTLPPFDPAGLPAVVLSGPDFVPFHGSQIEIDPSYVYAVNGSGVAPIHLPMNAQIVGWSLDGCHAAGGSISATLKDTSRQADGVVVTFPNAGVITYNGPLAECGYVQAPVSANFPRATPLRTFAVQVYTTNTDGSDAVAAVRIYYRLLVTVPPAQASFSDVPTDHWAYAFIEALKVSGVTQGCQAGPPRYCPDQTVTRAELAVFLARALGL